MRKKLLVSVVRAQNIPVPTNSEGAYVVISSPQQDFFRTENVKGSGTEIVWNAMEFPIQVTPDTSNLTAFVYVDRNVSKENAGRAEVPLNQVFGDGSQLGWYPVLFKQKDGSWRSQGDLYLEIRYTGDDYTTYGNSGSPQPYSNVQAPPPVYAQPGGYYGNPGQMRATQILDDPVTRQQNAYFQERQLRLQEIQTCIDCAMCLACIGSLIALDAGAF
ncbi:hypothetical protein Gasu2_68500 [Galdieria sulphuraria]|uniref:C2 domain-containing protein n=1 Tax=Galdieria sulphuraria TaxID=130081 RepID=M2W1S2_GALSU|nr:uncharacterized protein Gasu_30630 [Galdieria sulphuraria]EME29626.1 hypothetical protein Gasu_30630 [Galdieria sulphuraria]GJD12778.1 hypothetical protein Gasu2_68500 [Galdieria sulphuraria]|eukprot:XP_005706146.1 hypothetical protein Gasu_30630 [Galdieria sulphuraria]